jgi:hypothetical protein
LISFKALPPPPPPTPPSPEEFDNSSTNRMHKFRLSIPGIVGGLLGILSVFLPWWMITVNQTYKGITTLDMSMSVSLWSFNVASSTDNYNQNMLPPDLTYYLPTWLFVILALIVVGSLTAIIGSVQEKSARSIRLFAGLLFFVSVVLFFLIMGTTLSALSTGFSIIGSSSSLPWFGFFLALSAGILTFVSALKKNRI